MAKRKSEQPNPKLLTVSSESTTLAVSRAKALVFISHDSRDADLAEAFGNLLTDASGGILKSFRSSDKKGTSGIEFGAEWYSAIMATLDEATDVVALLTQHSIDRPWILYEAGVAKGKLNTTVFGIAIGVPLEQVSTGPFAQFQNSSDDEDSLTKLVFQLIRRNPDASPREEAVRRQVQAFRDNIAGLIKKRKASVPTTSPKIDETAIAKLFEEVKVMFSSLPERVEDKLRDSGRRRVGRRRRFHPGVMEDFLFHPAFRSSGDNGAGGWLMFISALREDFPWLYDLGLDVYRALRKGNAMQVSRAQHQLLTILDATVHSRAGQMLVEDDPESEMLFRNLLPMIDHYLSSQRSLKEDKEKGKSRKKETA